MEPTTKTVEWTADDSTQAAAQGWDIFECDGEFELQRDTDSNIFPTDDAAAAYVKDRAALGDPLACKAIAQLVSCGSNDVALFTLA